MTATAKRPPGRRSPYAVAALAVVAAAVVVALLVSRGDDNSSDGERGRASGVSVAELRALSRKLDQPLYWVGKKRSYTYELTDTGKRMYIRYLPPGVAVDDERPNFLTVGTYRYTDPIARLRAYRRERGATVRDLGSGGVAAVPRSRSRTVYLAFPGEELLVEVYAPSPARARRLAFSGRVMPVR
jgi:hypothetical protein